MDLEIILASDVQAWNFELEEMATFDFYHTAEYHLLDNSGEGRLLVFKENGHTLLLPLIFRKIPDSDLLDVSSVYGYVGLLHSSDYPFSEAFRLLEEYFKKEKVISAFSRIHPLIFGADKFERGELVCLNQTTAIDLSLSLEQQFDAYSKSVQRHLNKQESKKINIRLGTKPEDVEVFIKLYYSAMDNLQAAPDYYFSKQYFETLLNIQTFKSILIFCEKDGIVIAGGIFIICNNLMTYHLGAIVAEYRIYSPLKLLIDYARQIGTDNNCKTLHLGGGANSEKDGLFVFKSRMTSLRYDFCVWKWVVDSVCYQELTKCKQKSSFFPLYRASI